MSDLNENQETTLLWVIGGAITVGALILLARPKTAAAAARATGNLPPPPPIPEAPPSLPPPPAPACSPNPELLTAFGNANGIQIYIQVPDGRPTLVTSSVVPMTAPVLVWTPGEVVLRGVSGQVDQIGTASFCAYAIGQTPLQCSISGTNFSKFAKWVLAAYAPQKLHVVETSYPPPSLLDLQQPTTAGGITLPGNVPTEDNTLIVTRAPQEMVWRYFRGTPTSAPEVVNAFCQAVASSTVQGIANRRFTWIGDTVGQPPGCWPMDIAWWNESQKAGVYLPPFAHFYSRLYQWDLGSNSWYVLRDKGPYIDSISYGLPDDPEIVSGNPPWRYKFIWYWSNHAGWLSYAEAFSYTTSTIMAADWRYLYECSPGGE